jgi:hypothetical protein
MGHGVIGPVRSGGVHLELTTHDGRSVPRNPVKKVWRLAFQLSCWPWPSPPAREVVPLRERPSGGAIEHCARSLEAQVVRHKCIDANANPDEVDDR